jgi:tRNA1Val (adenine37-N6)-methyltransferase
MFHFKQFSVEDDSSSMKVGTDAVLLGITTKANKANKILDVGTGCGVVALMLAQKTNAIIDAIDIDNESCIQAQENFNISQWKERLNIINDDFSVFSTTTDSKYDLIVSNPPFFISGKRKDNQRVSRARHNDTLSYNQLCDGVSKLLNSNGHFYLILPKNTFAHLLEAANESGLFLHSILLIHPTIKKIPNRYIACFTKQKATEIVFDRLFIRENPSLYTSQYKNFVKEYYLDFACSR